MKFAGYILFFIVLIIAFSSCKNSPSTKIMGTYEGNYTRDTIVVGTATVNVIDVNALTVNLHVDYQNDPDVTISDVAVAGEDVNFTLNLNSWQGKLVGSVNDNHMNWYFATGTDSIIYNGDLKP